MSVDPTGSPYQPAPRKRAGFFRAMFDLRYESFAAPKVAAFIQVLVLIASTVAAGYAVIGLIQDEGSGYESLQKAIIVLVPIAWLLVNAFVRVVLELAVAVVRTAENTDEVADLLRAGRR